MQVTLLKPIIHGGLEYSLNVHVRYWAEINLEQKIHSSTEKYRTSSSLENEIKKNKLCFKVLKNASFWKNWQKCPIQFFVSRKKFYLSPRKVGSFFVWGLKKVIRLKQCPVYSFRFRNASYHGVKHICPQKCLRFRAWPIYAGFTHFHTQSIIGIVD